VTADVMLSFRVDAETAAEIRAEAERTGKPVADLIRIGVDRVLEYARARWHEDHRDDPGVWEIVAARVGTPRKMDSVFSVRLNGDQLHDVAKASNARGVPISAYMRDAALALAAAQERGGHVVCSHMALSPVTSAECAICGPLPVNWTVAA
jgi:hypothetical protein